MVKTGDRVRVVDNENTRILHSGMPECYPVPGSLGTVDKRTPTNNVYWVKWDSLQDDHPWAFPGRWLEVVEEELPAITATVKITCDKKYTRVEVDGECGEVLKALAFATASAIRNSTLTNVGHDFVLGDFKAALVEAFADTQEADDGTK